MKYYFVYRQYSEKEKHKHSDQLVFYGWTTDKSVVKAFLQQRSKDKYDVKKVDEKEIQDWLSTDDGPESNTMIDYVTVRMASTQEAVRLLMTQQELIMVEKSIQSYFREAARLVDLDEGHLELLQLYVNLIEDYKEPLEFIGFIPPETNYIWDSINPDENTTIEAIELKIDEAYDGYLDYPQEDQVHNDKIKGIENMPNIFNKIIYSLESFIKVIADDM